VTSVLRFSVLGPLSAEAEGRPLELGPLKQRAVLAALLCQPNTPLSVDLLTEAVWADDPPRTARKNLQMYISTLRRIFADAGCGERLSLRPGGYVLHVAKAELDALRFHVLARAGREAAAAGDVDLAVRRLHEARSLWTGPPLPEFGFSPVMRAEADRLTRRHLGVCEDWAEAALAAGRPGEVAEEIVGLVERHPLRERLRAAQMRALHRSGRRAEAMAAYDEIRQQLSRELGLSPSPALQTLYRAIMADEGAAPVASGAGRVTPVALPVDATDFTGRRDTLARLLEDVVDGGVGVLVGPAGAGKTALAVRAAHRLDGEFPDGRIFVRLRRDDGVARSLDAVVSELAAHAGIRGVPSDPERAAAVWRAWLVERRVLLVLDDASDEAAVRPLLPGAGRSTVIITARTQLAGLAPADRVPVPPLEPAEGLELLERLVGAARVSSDPAAAERLVAACGGLPLAVRAAGLKLAVLRHLPLAEYADRLADPRTVLDELAVGDLHVRARIADEWDRLDAGLRTTLESMASLPLSGWFTAEEAAQVLDCDRDSARRRLESMVEAGAALLPDSDVVAHSAAYSLPFLTHLYAREAVARPPADIPFTDRS
jgi:DNA-binding SARP family transcriptional activator